MAQAFDLAGTANAVGARPLRSLQRAGTSNACATRILLEGPKAVSASGAILWRFLETRGGESCGSHRFEALP